MLPKDIAKLVPKGHLMSEDEWRRIGVQQSQGWQHYMMHEPGYFFDGQQFIHTFFCFMRLLYSIFHNTISGRIFL